MNKKLLQYVLSATILCTALLKAEEPIEVVKKVADKVISETTFELYSKPQEKSDKLQIVKIPDSVDDNIFCAKSIIKAESKDSYTFGVASEGCIEIWIDGEKVFETEEKISYYPVAYDMYNFSKKFNAALTAGDNTIVVKAKGGTGKYFVLAAVDKHGMLDERLKFSLLVDEPQQNKYYKWMLLGPMNTELSGIPDDDYYEIAGKYYSWYIPQTNIVLDDVIGTDFSFTKHSYFEWHYANGQMLLGILALSDLTKDGKYYNYVKRYCDFTLGNYDYFKYQYDVLKEINGFNNRLYRRIMLDDTGAPAFPLLELLSRNKLDNAKFLIDTIATFISEGQARLDDGTLCRPEPREWTVWADDLFMSSPFLLRYAKLTGDDKYYDDAAKQILLFEDKLYDSKLNLFYHGWYSDTRENTPVHWGRANGWIGWAATEALLYLPRDHEEYNEILDLYKRQIDGLIKYQDKSGLWHQVIDHPESYEETSSSAMFTLAIARGVTNGWLDVSYKDAALKGWDAIANKISDDGVVSGICRGTGIGDDLEFYFNRATPPNDPRGLGAVLTAGVEVQKMINKYGE